MDDIETCEDVSDQLMSRHPPDDCLIVFENLIRAHFDYHFPTLRQIVSMHTNWHFCVRICGQEGSSSDVHIFPPTRI